MGHGGRARLGDWGREGLVIYYEVPSPKMINI